jgi:hypothetical protein
MSSIYISLGYNCEPRIYIKKKLKLTKNNGYKSCPFDLCITNFDALCKCIETNFEKFFDELKLIPGSNTEGNMEKTDLCGLNIINYYNIIFNHESPTHSHLFFEGKNDDEYYTRNNFLKFRERYENRITNFFNYIKNNDNIIFLYKKNPNDNINDEKINYLNNLLKEKYQKNIKINVLK